MVNITYFRKDNDKRNMKQVKKNSENRSATIHFVKIRLSCHVSVMQLSELNMVTKRAGMI